MSTTNDNITSAALTAVRRFLRHEIDIAALEQLVADLWVANDRELDGTFGDIYFAVTDWDHKFTLREVVKQLRAIVAVAGVPPN